MTALPLLAFLGIIIYIGTDKGTVKISGTDPKVTEQGGIEKATSPSPSVADGSKPASSAAKVPSPTPKSPPPQPGREWTNSIGIKLVLIEAGEFMMGSARLRSGCQER